MKPDKSKPWERQEAESEKAFSAFRIYLEMKPKARSFLSAYRLFTGDQKTKKVNPWHRKFAKDNKWKDRARAFDNRLVQVEQKAIEDETVRVAKRRVQARVEFWDAGRALMTKGLGILRFPLEEKTSEDGKTTIKPAKWTTKDAATLMRVGKELMCIASDIANEKIDVNIPAELKRIAEEHGIPAEEAQQIYDGVMSEVKAAKAGSKEIN